MPASASAVASSGQFEIRVGLASCGIAAGAAQVQEALGKALEPHGLEVRTTGCIGMCYAEPLVEVTSPSGERHLYGKVTPDKVKRIVASHLADRKPVDEWLMREPEALTKQHRIVLRNCGRVDPDSINDYISFGGYKAAEKALSCSPEEVIDMVVRSGLRGRGGAGFSTGTKWRFTRSSPGSVKYVVCNADEGDPGAFMDRSVLESDPHSVIEGMLIASYAIGANHGYIYVRAEYPLAVKRLKRAVEMAKQMGFLGKQVMGTGHDFSLTIREGAGAFVCGEETALLMSIEGRRGMPVPRPPFPSEKGLWGKPTCINNVETFANVPYIMLEGPEKFASLGTHNSKGTKVFALAGNVVHGGLVEVPMGTTLRQIIYDIGGGIPDGRELKAVQTGGPSGGCVPVSLVDTPVDYESLAQAGSIMGSGGLLVMDDSTCMVDVAKFFLSFTVDESCGKCTFCRVGTKQMADILERITSGKGEEADLNRLADLGEKIKKGSLCGLGQTAPNPVLTTLRYFRGEYEAHVREKRCPAKKCSALITYRILALACNGCSLCARNCPANAIHGEIRKKFEIDQSKCIKCGLCVNACKFKAITVE